MGNNQFGEELSGEPDDPFFFVHSKPPEKPKNCFTAVFQKVQAGIQHFQIEIGNRRVTKKYGLQDQYKEYKRNRRRS